MVDADIEGIDIQEHCIIQFSAVVLPCHLYTLHMPSAFNNGMSIQVGILYTVYYLFCLHVQISSACQISIYLSYVSSRS